MNHILEPDVAWLRDPGASVNRLRVHSTWRSRRPIQMLSSTWQVRAVVGTAAELIERAPLQREFEATSVPGVLESDGSQAGEKTELFSRARADRPLLGDRVRASILRREFSLDAPLRTRANAGG